MLRTELKIWSGSSTRTRSTTSWRWRREGFAPLGASKQLQEKLQTKALALLGEESERRPRVLAVVRQPDAHRLRGVEKAIRVAYELILDHKRTRLRTAELALARQAASDSTPPTFSSPHSEASPARGGSSAKARKQKRSSAIDGRKHRRRRPNLLVTLQIRPNRHRHPPRAAREGEGGTSGSNRKKTRPTS